MTVVDFSLYLYKRWIACWCFNCLCSFSRIQRFS